MPIFSLIFGMQRLCTLFLLFFVLVASSQNAELANSYFRKGEYAKAIELYKPLLQENPIRQDYFKSLLTCYQQIEDFDRAGALLDEQLLQFPNQVYLYVEIGYNYQLQGDREKAETYYEQAVSFVRQNPSYAFMIGRVFRQNHLLDRALATYQTARELKPELNTEINEAQIYGELGDIEKMFSLYLDLIEKNENYYSSVQRFIASFISDDRNAANNMLFKKLLLKKSQDQPLDSWNILLSWLFMQQGEYDKALVQERSLYRRNPENLGRVHEVGLTAFEADDLETAEKAFSFIVEASTGAMIDADSLLQARIYLLHIENERALTREDLEKIDEKFKELLLEQGNGSPDLQLAYSRFLAYSMGKPQQAIELLEKAVVLARPGPEKGSLQLALGDILVFTDQFNQALILYTQIQYEQKNSPQAQEARYRVAQTSYFKGDFIWAQNQLKVLKSSTSQLIANDALELSLRISNNLEKDSLNEGLRLYSKAELLGFQKKYEQAKDTLSLVLTEHKGRNIEDDAMFLLARIHEVTGDPSAAEQTLLSLLDTHPQSLLTDDSLYALGKLYENELQEPEKAKEMYERIIFEFPSSIYLVESRKSFRRLRGDAL